MKKYINFYIYRRWWRTLLLRNAGGVQLTLTWNLGKSCSDNREKKKRQKNIYILECTEKSYAPEGKEFLID